MSCVVNILTGGLASLNGRAFLYPLLRNRDRLRERDVVVRFFTEAEEQVYECDTLIIESKFYRDCWHQEEEVLRELASFHDRVDVVLFFDTGDSTGVLLTQVLPYVTAYFKNQLCKDRSVYTSPLYGARLYTDYYHREAGVVDHAETFSRPVSTHQLSKLKVSWNIAAAHYGMAGPVLMALHQRVQASLLLRPPRWWCPPSLDRPRDLSCRMTHRYDRSTVAYQRSVVSKQLRCKVPEMRVRRSAYLRELQNSKIVVSPFGWGEINTKDFETFISGALLLKPSMDHVDTYPELFINGETIVTHNWDLSDVRSKFYAIIDEYPAFLEVAREGQQRYRRSIASARGQDRWTDRFCSMIGHLEDRL